MLPKHCTKNFTVSFPVEIGFVNIVIRDDKYFDIALRRYPMYTVMSHSCPHILIEKLQWYFKGEKVVWSLDETHERSLTDFQRKMFVALSDYAPYGTVITYGQLAGYLHSSPRGVATALKYNNLPIVLPCHRVVAKNGIGGFSAGLQWKRYLLQLEGVNI
ncbi:methylated-DNA--[protein]-cysteine S-methyltransferase [Zhurongbacter thermophilus]